MVVAFSFVQAFSPLTFAEFPKYFITHCLSDFKKLCACTGAFSLSFCANWLVRRLTTSSIRTDDIRSHISF